MTRESRLLLTVVVMSGLGVAGLMLVANQYRRALTNTVREKAGGEDGSIRAIRLVDGYLAAREATKAVVERYPVKIKQLTAVVTGDFSGVAGQRMTSNADASSTYRVERWNALTAHGMTYEDYAAVRAAWRTYRSGGSVDDPALVAVFQAQRARLEGADLGPVEALDDAIK